MKPIYIFGRKRIQELEDELKATKEHLQGRIYYLEKDLSKTESMLMEERTNVKTLEGVRDRLLARIEELENNSKQSRDSKGRFTKKKKI